MAPSMAALSERDIEDFRRDGVIRIRGVVPEETLGELARAIEPHLRRPRIVNRLAFGDANFFTKPNVWKTDPYFFEIVQREVFLRLASQLLDSRKLNLLQDQLFVKLPNCDKPFDWHQDHAYAPVRGLKMVSFWMATKRITLESGGLEFIAGSHLWKSTFVPPKFLPLEKLFPYQKREHASADAAGRSPTEREEFSEDLLRSFDLEPGDVVAFHGRLFHRSWPNRSAETDRKGYAIRYVGDDMTYRPGPHTGITFNFWNAKLAAGDALSGPLFPTLYEGGEPVRQTFHGPEPMEIKRILLSQVRYFRDIFSRAGGPG